MLINYVPVYQIKMKPGIFTNTSARVTVTSQPWFDYYNIIYYYIYKHIYITWVETISFLQRY